MVNTGIPSTKFQKNSRSFTVALASAVLEWLLIIFLLIHAIFSYLVTRFADYCELQTPCLLCSRLDHVLGNKKFGFYWDLICRNHKLEISSLIFCRGHNKLVDVNGICDNCFSSAAEDTSNAKAYRLLIGNLCEEPHSNQNSVSSSRRHCSCCNEVCNSRGYSKILSQAKLVGFEALKIDLPRSGVVVHDHSDLKKRMAESVSTSRLESKGLGSLPHVGYTELKITSDTESDVPLSDDDNRNAMICENDGLREYSQMISVQKEPQTITSIEDYFSEKLINLPPFKPEPSLLVSEVPSVLIKPNDVTPAAPAVATDHGFEELSWQQAESKADPLLQTELISLDPPSAHATEGATEVSRQSNVSVVDECKQTHMAKPDRIIKTRSGALTIGEVTIGTSPLKSKSLDLGDAYKLAVGTRGRQLSGLLSEQWSGKDSARVNDDLKILMSQISASRGIELSFNDVSLKVPTNRDEVKPADAAGSNSLHILQKRFSLERNASGFESLDGSIVSEIEGESVVDRLKRQIEHDKKTLGALYKELEEERNASAIAASQAMAMITRLQEEKAALHMEALQCLRMMEEQAEYDMEDLQKANDLLAEKEKEIQDLEEELEVLRRKFTNESAALNVVDPACSLKVRDVRVDQQPETSCAADNARPPVNSVTKNHIPCNAVDRSDPLNGDTGLSSMKNPLTEFEDESSYISLCLKKLEKKLQLFSDYGPYVDFQNGEYSGKGDEVTTSEKLNHDKGSVGNSMALEPEGVCLQDGHILSSQSIGNCELNSGLDNNSTSCRETALATLGKEISALQGRLEALEADRNFLQSTINSLKKGDEGFKFVQEIVHHLHNLRRAGTRIATAAN